MSQYNVLQAIVMSFYSKRLYRDVAKNWGGKSFLYLLLLMALSCALLTFQVHQFLRTQYDVYASHFVAEIPVLTISNGKIQTPENHPYFIDAPDSKEILMVIDTSGKYTHIDQVKAHVLVTQNEIISRSDPNQFRVDTLPTNFSSVLNPVTLNAHIKEFLLSYAWFIVFVSVWFGSFIYRILQGLFYGLIGKLFSSMCQVNLSYSQIVQISFVAITPAVVLAAILNFLGVHVTYWLYFIVGIFYVGYGVMANKKME